MRARPLRALIRDTSAPPPIDASIAASCSAYTGCEAGCLKTAWRRGTGARRGCPSRGSDWHFAAQKSSNSSAAKTHMWMVQSIKKA